MNRNPRPLHLVPATLVTAIALYGLATGCGSKTEDTSATSTPPPATETPMPDTATSAGGGSLAEGKALYAQRCALCHGPDGRGDGPGAKGLNPPPRNHHDQAYMSSRTDADLLDVIQNGKGAMPAWGKVLTQPQIASLLLYVRELGKTP